MPLVVPAQESATHQTVPWFANMVGSAASGFGAGRQQAAMEDKRSAALQELTDYAGSQEGYDAEPFAFHARVLGILAKHRGEPGPVLDALVKGKQSQWEERKAERQQGKLAEVLAPDVQPEDYTAPTVTTDWPRRGWLLSEAGGVQEWGLPTEQAAEATPLYGPEGTAAARDLYLADQGDVERQQGLLAGLDPDLLKALASGVLAKRLAPEEGWSTPKFDTDTGVAYRTKGGEIQIKKGNTWTSEFSNADLVAPGKTGGGEIGYLLDEQGKLEALAAEGPLSPAQASRLTQIKAVLAKKTAEKEAIPADVIAAYEAGDKGTAAQKILVKQWERIHPGAQQQQRMAVRVLPDGTVELQQGANIAPTFPETTAIQGNLEKAQGQLAKLRNIGEQFNKNFLTYGGKLAAAWSSFKDKVGMDLSREEKDYLERFSAFGADAIEVLNDYIKYVTGAQMSEVEADRIRKAMPDPERDGPTQFFSKWKAAIARLEAAQARWDKLLRQGFTPVQATRMIQTGKADPLIRGATPVPSGTNIQWGEGEP